MTKIKSDTSDTDVPMADLNNLVAASNDFLFIVNERNHPDDGIADDDSWVENISQGEDDLNEFVTDASVETDCEAGLRAYSCTAIDFTLHTIVEESCEDSELEHNDIGVNESKEKNCDENSCIPPTDLEKYFFFGLGGGDKSNANEDSSSEICSDCSDNLDTIGANDYLYDTKTALDISTSRLEEYFLSGFMGFHTENKSDGSVGSDSEGQPSPSQRKKKFVRARGTPRSNNSSLDNLLAESVDIIMGQSSESFDSSESETCCFSEAGVICDKLDNIDSIKRRKSYRKRELLEQKLYTDCGKPCSFLETSEGMRNHVNYINKDSVPFHMLKVGKINGLTNTPSLTTKTSLIRKDSFNNWSSDEETNLMMSKMRQFFKALIAVTNHNYSQPNGYRTCTENGNQKRTVRRKVRAFRFPYFENELIRLMKTVPGINNQQVLEIVEYFSSEDTWSDSNDSSDYSDCTNVDDKKSRKNEHLEVLKDRNVDSAQVSDSVVDVPSALSSETVLVYKNLIHSLITKNSKLNPDDKCNTYTYSDKSSHLLAKVMQHIGSKLVALMHEVTIGSDSIAPENSEPAQNNSEENSSKVVLDNLDYGSSFPIQWGNLPRSKSHDILLGSTNRTWQFNSSGTVNENAGEVSDCDRFSWRGSFESALLAPGDSRSRLLAVDRDSCSFTSDVSNSKRGSVDDLTYAVVKNGQQLDRVQSCGSIGTVAKTDSPKDQMLWLCSLSDIKHRSDLEQASSIVIVEDLKCANSLSNLHSLEFSTYISDKSQSDSNVKQPNAKSARYRSPVSRTNIFSASLSKKNISQPSESQALNNTRRFLASSTSLDDFSVSEFNSVSKSPGIQRNQFNKRNNSSIGIRSDSLTSVYSDVFDNRYGSVKVKGQVEFAMQYNYKIRALEIHVVRCKDLAAVDIKRFKSDPYVKVYLLPDKSKNGKRKTKVKKHTLNPIFDEIMRFYVPLSNLENRSIWLTVWHSDTFGRNDFLGEVTIHLQGKVFDNPQSQWYLLEEKNEKNDENIKYRGDIVVAFKFTSLESSQVSTSDFNLSKAGNPKPYFKGQLQILIKEAKNLQSIKASGTCDAFCKSYLLPNRTRTSKQKTPVFKKSLNPLWNVTIVYDDVTLQELSERALELTIWDHDRLISNQFLGGARFSLGTGKHYGNKASWMDSKGKEVFLWQEMINRPNFWVEGSVNLRSVLHIKREETRSLQ